MPLLRRSCIRATESEEGLHRREPQTVVGAFFRGRSHGEAADFLRDIRRAPGGVFRRTRSVFST